MILSTLILNGQFNDAADSKKINDIEFASMEQSHSDIFLEVDKAGKYKADGLITKTNNLKLMVKTADCMPVLISDNEKVGVVHIGWKGLEKKIFYKIISKFNSEKLKVAIGPHAKSCCYEVKEDLESKFSKYCIKKGEKIYLNLSKEIQEYCEENNIDLEVSDMCTIDNKKYNSYRRDKTKNRQKSYVWI